MDVGMIHQLKTCPSDWTHKPNPYRDITNRLSVNILVEIDEKIERKCFNYMKNLKYDLWRSV